MQPRPHLPGKGQSQRISGVLSESRTWVPWVLEEPCPRLVHKESGWHHVLGKLHLPSPLQSHHASAPCPSGQARSRGAGFGAKAVHGKNHCSQNKAVNHSLATGNVCHPYARGTKDQQVTEAQDHIHVEEAGTIWGSSSWKWATNKTVPLGETLLKQRSEITPAFPTPIP